MVRENRRRGRYAVFVGINFSPAIHTQPPLTTEKERVMNWGLEKGEIDGSNYVD